jgi:sarcosine oxidase
MAEARHFDAIVIGVGTMGSAACYHLARRDGAFIRETLRAAQLHQLPCELIERERLAREHPQFTLPEDHVGLFEPNAGYVLPEAAVMTHANLAIKAGGELHGHEHVRSWTAHDDHVKVETDRGAYIADKLVICSGAWTSRIAAQVSIPLTVTRQVMGWMQPAKPERFAHGAFPVWAIEQDDGSLHYGFPIVPHGLGMKVAHHARGEPADPATINRIAQPEDESDFRDALRRILPQADGPLLAMRVCMYTNTRDSHFIIDRHAEHDRVVIACGFSGHGFKFAPVVGEILADLATKGATDHPIGFLSMRRFAAGV